MAEPGEDLDLGRGVVIPAEQLEWRFSGSGGPGGQHANTANSRAEVVFDIAGSQTLPEWARTRLTERYGPTLAVAASDHRSQYRNRRLAVQRLEARLRSGLVVQQRRVATRPTAGAVRRRLDDKRRQSERKADRRRPPSAGDD